MWAYWRYGDCSMKPPWRISGRQWLVYLMYHDNELPIFSIIKGETPSILSVVHFLT